MSTTTTAAPDPLTASGPRFLIEIVAWVAAPWALAAHSVVLAVLADAVLIGLPTVFGMPGAKKQRTPIHVGPVAALALEALQVVAAIVFSALAWPVWAAGVVAALTVVACVAQLPRWRWLLHDPLSDTASLP